jgi:hypothetical protein
LDVAENKRTDKKEGRIATMFMIISELLVNLARAIFCFQYDTSRKSRQMALNRARTHDLYDRKGVSAKGAKSLPLFSIAYPEHHEANGVVEPTMCMVGEDLARNRPFSAFKYVTENRRRSSLAAGNQGFGTHDVYEAEGISSRLCLADLRPPPLIL